MAIRQDLGAVSAYAIAVEQGYTGTEEEWIAELSSTTQNAETATAKALDSEAYALGTRDGSAVSSDDPTYHNNSKYYAEQAEESAQQAASYKATLDSNGIIIF